MLYKETVSPPTLELLRSLQSNDYLGDFLLVGGTALSLYWGHRRSIDLDLFSHLSHRYPLIGKSLASEGIAISSEPDILAMKLNAISVSGQRSKDFIDIFYAFKKYSLEEILAFYRAKYSQESVSHIVKSLIYFDDVDLSDWPVLLQDPQLEWKDVTERLEAAVLGYFRDLAGRDE